MMKCKFALFASLLYAGTAFGQCPLSFDECEQAIVGAYIAPINGDSVLVDYNSSKLMTPASVMKSVTIASVLSKYTGSYQWATSVMAVGNIIDSILDGNLIICGSGDPTIESKHFKSGRASFISAIKSGMEDAGIKSITGKVLLDEQWPDQGAVPSWELEDIPGIDGAGFYTLNYRDNIFTIDYPSLRTTPFIPNLKIVDNGGDGRLKFFRNSGSNELNIYGRLGKRETKATLLCSMPNPIDVALYHLSDTLEVLGNDVSNCQDTLMITTYKSPSLRAIARSLMVRSDNQMAEASLRLLAPENSRNAAIAAQKNLLVKKGANLTNANINDGSGLSRHNAISPLQLGSILRIMASNSDYVNAFPTVGKDGTVKNFMKGAVGRENFVLKSGSMTGVVAYAGYRLDPESKEPTHVIAIIVNNAPYASKARTAIAEFLSSVAF